MKINIRKRVRKFIIAHKIVYYTSHKILKGANLVSKITFAKKSFFKTKIIKKNDCFCEKRLTSDGEIYLLMKYENGDYVEKEEFKTEAECKKSVPNCEKRNK